MITEQIKPEQVNPGDTLIIDEEMFTISKKDIKTGFCGTLIKGIRSETFERVLFLRWKKGKFAGYTAQP